MQPLSSGPNPERRHCPRISDQISLLQVCVEVVAKLLALEASDPKAEIKIYLNSQGPALTLLLALRPLLPAESLRPRAVCVATILMSCSHPTAVAVL